MNMPELELILKPNGNEDYTVSCFDVTMNVKGVDLKKGEALVNLWKMVAGIPASPLGENGVYAEDERGEIGLELDTIQDPTGFPKTVWKTARDTDGDITIKYMFYPRDLSEVTRSHPLFDVCNEPGGCTMCGVTSLLALPQQQYKIKTIWDLSDMPAGSKAVSIKGGSFDAPKEYEGTPMDYTFSLYACGDLKSSEDESGKYHLYWLAPELPDQAELSSKVPQTIRAMCEFFKDQSITYDVFLRKDPFDMSGGGTAFDGGFIYGYSDAMPVSWDKSGNTIAHEIVHNWPTLDTENPLENWYAEGTAEYYSMVVPYRSGLISLEDFAKAFTDKCLNYYSNAYIEKSNEEAAGKTWEERDAQRIPYGRGLIYLVDLDMRLKKASNGEKSVDNLVLELLKIKNPLRTDWEKLVTEALGAEEAEFLDELMKGEIVIEPNEDWFDGAFAAARGRAGDAKSGIFDDAVIWTKSNRKEVYAI